MTINSVNVSRMRINTDDIFSGQMLLSVLCYYSVLRWFDFQERNRTLNEEVLQFVYDCFDHKYR